MRLRLAPKGNAQCNFLGARLAPRTRNRFATFAHAISNTNITAPNSTGLPGFASPTNCVANWLECHAELIIGRRIFLLQPRRNAFHFHAGLRERDARRKSANHGGIAALATTRRLRRHWRWPTRRWATTRPFYRASENSAGSTPTIVKLRPSSVIVLPMASGIGSEMGLPKLIAEQNHRRCARFFLGSIKIAAEERADAYHRKKIRRHRIAVDFFRLGDAGEIEADLTELTANCENAWLAVRQSRKFG